jgi:4-amino-4-deoxy-L-arabinose transferase-like glycosyltransferase
MVSIPFERTLIIGIMLGYLLVGGLYALYTPDWQAPDEPAHYNYVAQVAGKGCCPVIEVGDWQQAYQNRLTTARFHPDLLDRLPTIQYEDHQPPLYYLLASVVYQLTDGSLRALRLFSVLLGLGVVISTYAIGKVLFPDRPQIALGAAAFVAFLPQHVAMLAAVNNDALAEVVIGGTLLATMVYLKGNGVGVYSKPIPAPFVLGVLVGIGLITKTTTYFLAGIVPLAIFLRWWSMRSAGESHASSRMALLRSCAWFLIPALVLGGLWWLRNLGVYSFPDLLGLARHDFVVADQPRTADAIARIGFGPYLRDGLQRTFNSFWGQFGWMALPLPAWIYTVLQVLTIGVISGLSLDFFYLRKENSMLDFTNTVSEDSAHPTNSALSTQHLAHLILWLTLILALLAYLYYNSEFLQTQGRYLFPALIPVGLGMALGLDAWRRLLTQGGIGRRLPDLRWLTALAYLPLAALDVYVLWRFIVPLLSP